MTNQIGKPLEDDDVLHFPATKPLEERTAKVERVVSEVRASLARRNELAMSGTQCEYLSAKEGGWRKGKLYIQLTFVPDEGEVTGRDDVRES